MHLLHGLEWWIDLMRLYNKDLICSPHALQALVWLQYEHDDPAPKRNWLGGMFQELFDTGSTIQNAIYRVKKIKYSNLKYLYV